MQDLHIDIETYSSIDIRSSGAYRYFESIDFEILMVAYAFNDEDIQVVDLANGETLPERFTKALVDPETRKYAHNAVFERKAFDTIGIKTEVDQWHCTAIKAAYCGLPISLEQVSKAMKLKELGKKATGKALIRYFCMPCKPTKSNLGRQRNMPWHDEEKWEEFLNYCIYDVVAEREIHRRLKKYKIPKFERLNYLLDQKINDKGILVDVPFAQSAFDLDERYSQFLKDQLIEITGVDNPNSPAQLKKWLSDATGKQITTLAKASIGPLIKEIGSGPVVEVLKLRKKSSKTSTKKYVAMLNCASDDDLRARGLFQFYGANRTGRWAGRLVQLQNLPQNKINYLQTARDAVEAGDYDLLMMLTDDMSSLLSQLIRTAFIAPKDYTYAVADFSAIEARVIAWLANERWRLDVFATHGKIYEASASMMFNVPIEDIHKGSELRTKGKIAELALGYQGSIGALRKMGGEAMGLSDSEMRSIVKLWREKNKNIYNLWYDVDRCAKKAYITRRKVVSRNRGLEFDYDGQSLTIKLPSGRKLFYAEPSMGANKFGSESLQYKGMDQATRQWFDIDTYGGKLVENIVQAIARDLLAYSMLKLDREGFNIVMHVHDEVICEVPLEDQQAHLDEMCRIMGEEVPWAPGLPLEADGYLTPYYKKD